MKLWYRLDGRIDHLLLDEFQDTASTQWRVLRPLAEEIVSTMPPDRTFFCVGDMKQSIYGWRQAEPQLLGNLRQLLGEHVEQEMLSKTRRCAQPIVDAVNAVFQTLNNTHIAEAYEAGCETWSLGFEHHETLNSDPGYVELREASYINEDYKREPARLDAAVQCIHALHTRRPSLSIGVLTRDNSTVTKLLTRLNAAAPHISASGYGGTSLIDSAPVNAILDALSLADHPMDTAAAFHLANSPMADVIRDLMPRKAETDTPDVHGLYARGRAGSGARAFVANQIRRMLLEKGFGGVISAWVGSLSGDCDAREARRLTQLADVARNWSATGWHPIADFIAVVENRRVADVVPATVQIMTVHQAKGLEFDAVVLPELDEQFVGSTDAVAYERTELDGKMSRICRYMNAATRRNVPELEPLFEQQKSRTVRDSLSLLYVAMTRAKSGLYMIVDGRRDSDNLLKGMSGLLRAQLDAPTGDAGALYASGEPQWIERMPAAKSSRHDESEPARKTTRKSKKREAAGQMTLFGMDEPDQASGSVIEMSSDHAFIT